MSRERGGRSHRAGGPPPAPDALPPGVVGLDAHCHLDLIGGDPAAVVDAARAVGIDRVVTIGIDLATSRWAVRTAAGLPHVAASVGVHPNEVTTVDDETLRAIEALASGPDVVAVGETGLDHFRTGEDGHRRQEEAFRAHIAIAKAAGRALVIHDRDAHEDVLRVLTEEGAPERTVFHCFSGDAAFARACVDRGFVLSFAGNVTFGNAGTLRDAAAVVPDGQLLVETDAPFLTPVPFRGHPNAPVQVPRTLRVLAEVRGQPLEELCAGVDATAKHVFGEF